MNPIKQYSCCNGHQFNHDEVKEWMGTPQMPQSQSICPYCWPDGFLNRKVKDESESNKIESLKPDIPKDIEVKLPQDDRRDQGCPECYPDNVKIQGAVYNLCARHYNEYMISKDFPKPIEGVFISKEVMDSVKELLKVQKSEGNWNYDEYMHGMANGMILILAVLEGKETQFLDAPITWLKDYPKKED